MSVSQFNIWEWIKEKNPALTLPFPYKCINQLSNGWWGKGSLRKTTPANTWRTHDRIECYRFASCNESRYWTLVAASIMQETMGHVCPLVAEHNTTWETVLPKTIKFDSDQAFRSNYNLQEASRIKENVIMRIWPSKSRVWDIPEDKWPGSFNNTLPGWELKMEGKLIRLKRYINQIK